MNSDTNSFVNKVCDEIIITIIIIIINLTASFLCSKTSTAVTQRNGELMQIPVLLPLPVAGFQPQPTLKMCCWPFADLQLEDAPKKEEEEQKEYVLVSDELTLHPGVS